MPKSSVVIANVLAWMMACVSIGEGADSIGETVVSINGMHCSACAKKFTNKLKIVSNVKTANVDVEKGTAVIGALDGQQLSPKAVWEAIETAGYKPTELKGPGGTFKSKPTK